MSLDLVINKISPYFSDVASILFIALIDVETIIKIISASIILILICITKIQNIIKNNIDKEKSEKEKQLIEFSLKEKKLKIKKLQEYEE